MLAGAKPAYIKAKAVAVIPACTRMIEGAQADTPHDRAVLYYDRGIAYKNEKQFDRALADYSDAIKLDPKYAHAYLNRALVYASNGDYARSIADSSAAIKLDPTNMLPYLNRGLAYRSQRNFDAAIADFTEANDNSALSSCCCCSCLDMQF